MAKFNIEIDAEQRLILTETEEDKSLLESFFEKSEIKDFKIAVKRKNLRRIGNFAILGHIGHGSLMMQRHSSIRLEGLPKVISISTDEGLEEEAEYKNPFFHTPILPYSDKLLNTTIVNENKRIPPREDRRTRRSKRKK